MAVRTYFWETNNPKSNRRFWQKASTSLTVGNVGDIYNRDVIRYLYNDEPENAESGGKRLLLVGSTVHRLQTGDVLAGVGTKGADIPPASSNPVRIFGVRGPLTAAALEKAGYSLADLRFMFDPGLLIDRVFPELMDIEAEPGRVVFIPHYRERHRFRSNRRYTVLDVDSAPREFGREIRRAEVIYSSSLHGVIFAHALQRDAVLVRPLTEESELKYRDYFASVKLPWSDPMELHDAMARAHPSIPANLEALTKDFEVPAAADLRVAGVIV